MFLGNLSCNYFLRLVLFAKFSIFENGGSWYNRSHPLDTMNDLIVYLFSLKKKIIAYYGDT